MDEQKCPKCGEECLRESVDVGVGFIHGPYGCPGCGWSEDSMYDHSDGGPCKDQDNHPGWYVDQYGVAHNKEHMKEAFRNFRLDPKVIDDVFP